MLRRIGPAALPGLLAVALFFGAASTLWAQANAGVVVDAEGVLRMNVVHDPGGRLTRQRIQAALQALAPDVAAESPLRKISLNRLQKAIETQLDKTGRLTNEMLYLAGLTRVTNVFFYPDSGDIVIAGPAEGWAEDLTGRVRGVKSGRPVVELQDLVVALRAYHPNSDKTPLVGCSIDPTQKGLAAMQNFLRSIRPTPRDAKRIAAGLRSSLGLQTVTVLGIPPETHLAQVLVEADYRMKLIGIGLEKPPVKMRSYIDVAKPSQVSRNAMQRWYFVPNYECVRVSEDQLAMQLEGQGVKLVGEDEVVAADGARQVAPGMTNRASQVFVQAFTKKYPELAAKIPVYAQLRNAIDLLVVAAFIRQQDYYGQANWYAETLMDEEKVKCKNFNAPKQVATAVNIVWKGGTLMTPVGGGVTIHAEQALASANLLKDEQDKVNQRRRAIKLGDLKEGQWWWD